MFFRRLVFLLPLGLTPFFGSCDRPINMLGEPSSPYHDVLSDYTESQHFYHLDKVDYETSVTYKARPLREAYVEEYARIYALPPEKKEAKRVEELAEAEKYDAFLISHFATDKDVSKLTKDSGAWRLTLQTGSQAPVEAESITTLAQRDSVLHYFYPQIGPWAKAYLVKFPRSAERGPLQLRMTGIEADIKFDFSADGAKR